MRIPLLQRYIFGEILRVFALVLTALTVLLVFVGVFQQATEHGLGPWYLLQVIPYLVPSMLPFTIPATLLLTVSVVYGRIAGDQEVVAAKAAGINVLSLLWPSFVIGAVLSVGSLVLTDQVIPWAMQQIQRVAVSAMEDVFLDRLRTDHLLTIDSEGITIGVRGVQDRRLIKPVFRQVRPGKEPVTVHAQAALVEFDLERQEAVLRLKDGFVDLPDGEEIRLNDEHALRVPMPNRLPKPKPRYLSVAHIESEIAQMQQRQRALRERNTIEAAFAFTTGDLHTLAQPEFADAGEVSDKWRYRLDTEKHSRYALACSCFFFVLLGSPFSVLQAKSQFLTSFLYCFGPIVGVYYPLVLGLMAQSKRGAIDPAWSMWVANALVALAAVYYLRKVCR